MVCPTPGTTVQVLSVRRFRAGYEVRTELHGWDGVAITMRTAYTHDGAYIGEPRWAAKLAKRGIKPELRAAPGEHGGRVCSIGFCEAEQKWYGWSHRAICGFGIGDRIFEERYGNDKTPFVKHGRKTIKTMDDARLAASRFAESVS